MEVVKKNDGSDNWQALQRPAPGILAGSAIDLSVYFPALLQSKLPIPAN